ncbi:uncharacterized protein B0I36DRAFT_334834 [Microdochium trichocladiopsis]|uniref:Uncharacterized protein n=1 Tax=Microdochium trichocladiopsis TaxID=1682393 RepID=A0A9P8XYZ1_9PEZI|nr:uncharacterized protein B0I36DRAFT_334834 [Microdochium trichocladiopsis]KAH7021600.1 hypothetical protein B0I36DRAFT_334834 [Microdochium trichocladiopsis]
MLERMAALLIQRIMITSLGLIISANLSGGNNLVHMLDGAFIDWPTPDVGNLLASLEHGSTFEAGGLLASLDHGISFEVGYPFSILLDNRKVQEIQPRPSRESQRGEKVQR